MRPVVNEFAQICVCKSVLFGENSWKECTEEYVEAIYTELFDNCLTSKTVLCRPTNGAILGRSSQRDNLCMQRV